MTADDIHVIVTEDGRLIEYDQEPWEKLPDGRYWFKAKSALITEKPMTTSEAERHING